MWPPVGGRRSEVGGGGAEVGGRRSGVGGRRSEVGGRRSEVGGRRSEPGRSPQGCIGRRTRQPNQRTSEPADPPDSFAVLATRISPRRAASSWKRAGAACSSASSPQ